MKLLAASLRVDSCDKWKRAFNYKTPFSQQIHELAENACRKIMSQRVKLDETRCRGKKKVWEGEEEVRGHGQFSHLKCHFLRSELRICCKINL